MTVKELMDRIKSFDSEAQVTAVHDGDNPISDYSKVEDVCEIRGSSRKEINRVVFITD